MGKLCSSSFLEENIIGRYGFGYHINPKKKVRDLMEEFEATLEAETLIEEAAKIIKDLDIGVNIENICISQNGSYLGIIDVTLFLDVIMQINLQLAKGANPLTGLPGNESIQREITRRLAQDEAFDVLYIDIDNFKPYNDNYGFERGDTVIRSLAVILASSAESQLADSSIFLGHIGGDDFIVICSPEISSFIAEQTICFFEEALIEFHGNDDFVQKSYTAVNRKGNSETFDLLSLSIGIVSTGDMLVNSYAQLASLATEVKKAAKSSQGSSIARNRRKIFVSPQMEMNFRHA